MAEVYIATTDAVVNHAGELVRVRRNVTRVASGHPLLEQHPQFFKPAEDNVHFGVRTAREEPEVPARTDEAEASEAAEPEAEPDAAATESEDPAAEPQAEKPQRRSRRS